MKRLKLSLLLCGMVALAVPGVARYCSAQQTPEQTQRTEVKINPESFDRFAGQYTADADPDSV